MPLTDVQIRQAKPREKFYDLRDGGGLYIRIQPSRSKLWRLDYRFNNKRLTLALGAYPAISLAQAREERATAKALIADGVNPSDKKKADKLSRNLSQQNTFGALSTEWLEAKSPGWAAATERKIKSQVNQHLLPDLENRPITTITAPELIAVLNKLKQRGTIETLHRCLEHVGNIFRYAIQTHRAERNIAEDLKGAFPAVQSKNHAAIVKPKELAPLLLDLEGYQGHPLTVLALRLLPLVFIRPGELRQAKWEDFDLENSLWEIQATDMKGKKQQHIVPLAHQTVTILKTLHDISGGGMYVFPSLLSNKRPMSENTLNVALRRMGYDKNTMTAHGFRATARTILDEELEFPSHLIEHQLAHMVKDANGTAYNRTKHLRQRTDMMQAWADYLDKLKAEALGLSPLPEPEEQTEQWTGDVILTVNPAK